MATKRKRSPPKKKENKQELTGKERILNKTFKKAFVPTGEVLKVLVKSCQWNSELSGTVQEAIQIGFDSFLSINHQDDKKPWFRYVFLKENIELDRMSETGNKTE